MLEGKHIHFSPVDNKPLCSSSDILCREHRLSGYAFCIRHILEDKSAPFKQCAYVAKNNHQKCTNPVPSNEEKGYCNSHMQEADMAPKKEHQCKKDKMVPSKEELPPPPMGGRLKISDRIKALVKSGSNAVVTLMDDSDEPEDPYAFSKPEPVPKPLKLYQNASPNLNSHVDSIVGMSNLPVPKLLAVGTSETKVSDDESSKIMNRLSSPGQQSALQTVKPSCHPITYRSHNNASQTSFVTIRAKQSHIKGSQTQVSGCTVQKATSKSEMLPFTLTRVKQIYATINESKQDLYPLGLEVSESEDSDCDSSSMVQRHWFSRSLERPLPDAPPFLRFNTKDTELCLHTGHSEGKKNSSLDPDGSGTKMSSSVRQVRLNQVKAEFRRRLNQYHNAEVVAKAQQRMKGNVVNAIIEAARKDPNKAATLLQNKGKQGHRKVKKSSKRTMLISTVCSYRKGEEDACTKIALPCTSHCVRHIMCNVDQLLFEPCSSKFLDNTHCCVPAFLIRHGLPLCIEHARERDNYDKMYSETRPKKASKKVKPLPMTRKRRKKRRIDNVRSRSPESSVPDLSVPQQSEEVDMTVEKVSSLVDSASHYSLDESADRLSGPENPCTAEEKEEGFPEDIKGRTSKVGLHTFKGLEVSESEDSDCDSLSMVQRHWFSRSLERPLPDAPPFLRFNTKDTELCLHTGHSEGKKNSSLDPDGSGTKMSSSVRQVRLNQVKAEFRRRLNQYHNAEVVAKAQQRMKGNVVNAIIEAARKDPNKAATLLQNKGKQGHLKVKNSSKRTMLISTVCSYRKGEEDACTKIALPCTSHCVRHIMCNVDQLLFEPCSSKFLDNTHCCVPAFLIRHGLPLCIEHARERDNYDKMYSETRPKKASKKVKPLPMTRKRRKKRRIDNVRSRSPESSVPDLSVPQQSEEVDMTVEKVSSLVDSASHYSLDESADRLSGPENPCTAEEKEEGFPEDIKGRTSKVGLHTFKGLEVSESEDSDCDSLSMVQRHWFSRSLERPLPDAPPFLRFNTKDTELCLHTGHSEGKKNSSLDPDGSGTKMSSSVRQVRLNQVKAEFRRRLNQYHNAEVVAKAQQRMKGNVVNAIIEAARKDPNKAATLLQNKGKQGHLKVKNRSKGTLLIKSVCSYVKGEEDACASPSLPCTKHCEQRDNYYNICGETKPKIAGETSKISTMTRPGTGGNMKRQINIDCSRSPEPSVPDLSVPQQSEEAVNFLSHGCDRGKGFHLFLGQTEDQDKRK